MNRDQVVDALVDLRQRIDQVLKELVGQPMQVPVVSPSAERFNYLNRAHRIAVEELFKQFDINERRQGYFLNRLLINVPMSELAAKIEAEDAAYKKQYPPQPFRVQQRRWQR